MPLNLGEDRGSFPDTLQLLKLALRQPPTVGNTNYSNLFPPPTKQAVGNFNVPYSFSQLPSTYDANFSVPYPLPTYDANFPLPYPGLPRLSERLNPLSPTWPEIASNISAFPSLGGTRRNANWVDATQYVRPYNANFPTPYILPQPDTSSKAIPSAQNSSRETLNRGLAEIDRLERSGNVSYDFSQMSDYDLKTLYDSDGLARRSNPQERAAIQQEINRRFPGPVANNPWAGFWQAVTFQNPNAAIQRHNIASIFLNRGRTIAGEEVGPPGQQPNMFGERLNSALNGLVGGTGVARAPQISVPIGGTNTASINKTFDDINAGLQGAETDRRNQQAEHQKLATQYQNERQAMRDLPPPRIEPLNMFYGMLAANIGKVLNPNLNTEQQFQSLVTNKLNALTQDRLMDYQDKAQQYSEASALANKAGDAAESIRLARLGDVAMQRANAILQDRQMAQQRAAATAERLALQRETIGEKAFSLRFKSIDDQMTALLKIDPNLKDKKNKTSYQRLVNQRNAMQDALDKSGNSFANIRLDPHFATRQLLQSVDLSRVTNAALFWQQSGLNDRRLREAGVTRADIVKFLRENGINEVR